MTKADFQRRVKLTRMRGRTLEAAERVLVGGKSRHEAADQVGIDMAAVSRAVAKIEGIEICKCCGQMIRG